jgi:sigma-B regulation protein RsbU (phosphoserine phosphatase)
MQRFNKASVAETLHQDMALTNESFSFLSHSSDFLNIVLNNVNSCILLLDKDVRLRAYNDPLKTIFSNRKHEDLLYVRCGEAIGCAFQIEEKMQCGKTSKCNDCELRVAALTSYMNNEAVYKEHIVKPFFTHDNIKIEKHLQFSTRTFHFNGERYIVMIIEDISRWFEPVKGGE